MDGLYSGAELRILEDGLGNVKREQVVRYSQRYKEIIEAWKKKGFSVKKARVNFIVYWRDDEKNMEVLVLLTELYFSK